ncbi:MAG: DUF1659 domain-containing protein [Syntrophomonadaceae bacterium]|jgi:hypothetical protein|nr:DUF1659 domain-containing protein [Bacillota bacterium]NLP22912.1 DUF1659 domain-containing protein [Syntrophomonadaceae bacterium]
MAVTTTPVNSELVLVLDNGIGSSGQQLIRNRAYGDVKPEALDDNVYQVAQVILDLQDRTALAIHRQDTVELTNA